MGLGHPRGIGRQRARTGTIQRDLEHPLGLMLPRSLGSHRTLRRSGQKGSITSLRALAVHETRSRAVRGHQTATDWFPEFWV